MIHWFADGSPWNTNRYAYDSGGKIYQITSADSVSSIRTVSGGAGEGLLVFDNALYYALGTNIGRYAPLDNSPAFDDDLASWDVPITTTGGDTGATDYSTTTGINEGATHRQTFTAEYDPIKSITIDVDVVGTGDWTVTVHNANNDTIGSATIANGSVSTGDVVFTFSSPLRVTTGNSYHFHVTTTVADGGVDTGTNDDLEDAEFTVTYNALIDADFHPIQGFQDGFAVGNEQYIGYFDNATYEPNKIKLAPGFQVRSMTKVQEFIVVEAWKGQSFDEAEEQRRYFWDGIAVTFNFFVDLKEGVPNAVYNHKNRLIGVYGNRGSVYLGGDSIEGELQEVIDEVPKLTRSKKVEVYPGAITTHEERLLIGYSAVTDDATGLEQGIYEFGSQNDKLANVLNYPYRLSTNTTQGTTLKIGAIDSFGQDLLVGWRDDSSYGIDKLDQTSTAVASGNWNSRIFDAGNPDRNMQAIKIEATFEPLASGETIQLGYQLDRSGSFTTSTAESTVGATRTDLFINAICKEIEWQILLTSSGGTYPIVTSLSFVYDDLSGEQNA